METVARTERMLYGLALIVAPLLLVLATFFWQGSDIGLIGGAIQVYAYLFWIPALLGLLSLLRVAMPTFSVWGILLVCWVCIAGNNFGMDGIYLASFMQAGVDSQQVAAAADAMGVVSLFVLYMPGLLFPLTLILLAFLLWRTQAVSPRVALLLCLGAAAFPISRITRIEIIAHLADLLLLVGAGTIGWQLLRGEGVSAVAPHAVGAGDD